MTFPISEFEMLTHPVLVSDTRTADNRLYRHRNQGSKTPYYMFEFASIELDYAESRKVSAKINSYQGSLVIFQLPNPMISLKSHTGLTVAKAGSKGSDTITLGGGGANITNAFLAGDFIRPNGSAKAYEIAEDASTDFLGEADVKLTQALVQDYAANASVDYGDDVEFQVCVDSYSAGDITPQNGLYAVHDLVLIEQL